MFYFFFFLSLFDLFLLFFFFNDTATTEIYTLSLHDALPIIAMGYLSWAADIHMGSSSARHIEEIRRLTSKAKAFTNESERAAFEAQMLYGVHVFSRAKVIPDLALSRGEQAHAHARELGDRSLEFLAAGGTAMSHL